MKMLSPNCPEQVALQLSKTKLKKFPYLTYKGSNVFLSAENWEGIGCEFRKYTNLINGNGRKRIYRHNTS